MATEPQVKLSFISVDFPVVNFTSEKQFLGEGEINIGIEPQVYFPKDNNKHFKIIQEVTVSVQDTFKIFLVAVGSFELHGEIDEHSQKSFVNINAPAIMFPYIRSFISTLTSNLGNVTGTLNIPPQFFKGDLPIITEPDSVD